jgi:salicylate hydroxylase
MVSSYFQMSSPVDPLVSPIYGDFRGWPPLLIQAGRKEVLVDEAMGLAARAEGQGVKATLELYDERLHIFSLFPFLPNAARALAAVRAFVAGGKR